MSADDAFYRRFFEVLPDAAFIVDPRSDRFLGVSEASAALYGRTRDELCAISALALSAEPDATRAALEVAASGVHQRLHRRADGSTFLVEASTQRLEWDGRLLVAGVTRDVSTQQRFEAELRERRALIDASFHKSPLLLSISVFPERRHVLVNETFCEVSGFSREELVGHSSVELGIVDPVEVKALEAELRDSGRLNGKEFVIHSRTRGAVNVRFWSKVLDTREGPRLFTAAQDITARKEAEAARALLHHRLLRIADRLPGVIFQFRMRPDGAVSFPFASRAQKELYGVEPADVKEDGRSAFAGVHPEDLPAVFESIQRSARELSPWRLEHRVRGADGQLRWLEGNAVPEREADGSILWNGFIEDVTARKANEAALRKSDERFQLALEATRDALWERDLVTGQLSMSPHFARALGYEPETFTGGPEFVHPDDRPRVEAAARPCIEGRAERFEVEYRVRASDGSWRWFLTRGKCISRDVSGRATRLLGTNADITERKASQLSLAQTERLASTGLIAAGMAHEINNPLASVHANLDALSSELPKLAEASLKALAALRARGGDRALVRALELELSHFDELLTATTEALDGARRIQKISHGLGTFARPERPERTPVDVNEAIESAATMAHRELKARAQLVKELGPLPPVRGSEGKLAQVFLNLFVNAAHAIDEGAPEQNEVRVRSWAEGAEVHVEVKDTGRGIPRELLERIFEPFFTTKRAGLGSGLGLSISRSIITEHGGTLRVESEPGRGTTVRVQLPGEFIAASRTSRPAPPPSPQPARAHARVLVVDDEAPIRRTLQRVLKDHDVTLVASGREAKALLEQDDRFDVVLCDLMMPEMTGMELHAWLVEAKPAVAERIVFISGGAFTPNAAAYLERAKNPQLSKPFDTARLKALVAEYAGRAS